MKMRARSGSTSSVGSSITCTAYGPAGPAVFSRPPRTFAPSNGSGSSSRPKTRTRPSCRERVDGKSILFHRPTSGFATVAAASRSHAHPTCGAGAHRRSHAASPWRLVGSLRIGMARRCSRPSTAGCSSTTASRRRWRCDLSGRTGVARSRRADTGHSADRRLGARAHEAYERGGDVPNALFPCGLIHDAELRRPAPLLRGCGHVYLSRDREVRRRA